MVERGDRLLVLHEALAEVQVALNRFLDTLEEAEAAAQELDEPLGHDTVAALHTYQDMAREIDDEEALPAIFQAVDRACLAEEGARWSGCIGSR
jgi:hypothetical protein